jgi:hypothetical protein
MVGELGGDTWGTVKVGGVVPQKGVGGWAAVVVVVVAAVVMCASASTEEW